MPKELALLGGFVFPVEGEALLGISTGSQRLVSFLAVRDEPVSRDAAAGMLWPESSGEQADVSLSSAISSREVTLRPLRPRSSRMRCLPSRMIFCRFGTTTGR